MSIRLNFSANANKTIKKETKSIKTIRSPKKQIKTLRRSIEKVIYKQYSKFNKDSTKLKEKKNPSRSERASPMKYYSPASRCTTSPFNQYTVECASIIDSKNSFTSKETIEKSLILDYCDSSKENTFQSPVLLTPTNVCSPRTKNEFELQSCRKEISFLKFKLKQLKESNFKPIKNKRNDKKDIIEDSGRVENQE